MNAVTAHGSPVVNILYVEDNDDIRNMVHELIENPGRRVVACADAETAWAQLQQQSFDILITDVNLPGWSGTELARLWLQDDPARWVILFSGYAFTPIIASLGPNVRAVPKDEFEQLEQLLDEINKAALARPLAGS